MTQYKRLISLAIILACVLLAINFGLRSSMGFFMKPISETFGYGREIFAFSLALQNLFWGLSQPIAGAIADRYGSVKVIVGGALLYSLGLYITANAGSIWELHTGAGILIGMGISGTGFGVVLPAMARMVAPERRAFALGLGTAAGSAGQVLLIPVARGFIESYGWQVALIIMAVGALMMILLAPPFAGDAASKRNPDNEPNQTLREALKEASGHFHYWLLVAGFFVCGFQLAFITVHMPAYLSDQGFDSSVAAASLALIGLFNIIGSLGSGFLSGIYSMKWLLVYNYAGRAIILVLFLVFPISTFSVYAFSITTGLLWLATVPPTSGLVAQMFGLRYMGTLYGIVFLSHQIGSFTGVWLGGYLFDNTGSYDVVWWATAIIAAITAFIHIFIDERPVARLRLNASTT
ncbi:MAG: MFS transporter [Gammaproteobacteria bacterium]|nr:MFS transporter [Gammaproteobacteria bacterium]MCZ6797635.1 MFS transporter [Gammaproteobacteria bacterium]MCZ6881702.1 MFS transporter [Gammaproteobacteria bacterium]